MSATTSPDPLVSVLIPCWNAQDRIASAIASVLEERSVPMECIVVDDGSTDRTAEIVATIGDGDPRVTLIRQPKNAGVSSARNRGLELVRGQWLTMLDADDRFLPGGLGTLIRSAMTTSARAVIGQQIWWDGHRIWRSSLYDIPDIRSPGRKSVANSPGLVYYASPHAKLFDRSCFEGLRFSGRVLGDQPWIIRALIRAGDDVVVLDETVYEWYRPRAVAGQPSITSTTRASARGGIEAAQVAAAAFDAVAAEAGQRLDAPGRDAILTRYAERLLRSDLSAHLVNAMRRRDPGTAELIDAVGAFIAGPARAYLDGSDALARDILEPPIMRWHDLDDAGRLAFRRLAGSALVIDPSAARRRPLLARLGLAAGLSGGSAARRELAGGLLRAQWLTDAVARRVRRRLAR